MNGPFKAAIILFVILYLLMAMRIDTLIKK